MAVVWKESVACSCCERKGPEHEWFGYAVDAARKQGIDQVSLQWWYKKPPEDRGEFTMNMDGSQGDPLPDDTVYSCFGYVCDPCKKDMIVKEYVGLMDYWCRTKQYRKSGGAGGWGTVTSRYDDNCKFTYFCAVCLREAVQKEYDFVTKEGGYDDRIKNGWVKISVFGNGDGMDVCPSCQPKTTIAGMARLYKEKWMPEHRRPGYKPKCLCGETFDENKTYPWLTCPRRERCKFYMADQKLREPDRQAGFPRDDDDQCYD